MQHRENILVDFRRQFDYIDFTCNATSCFQNVYDNVLTTTHTHTKQWYCRLVYIKCYTKNLKIIWQYFKVTGNNSIGWNIFSCALTMVGFHVLWYFRIALFKNFDFGCRILFWERNHTHFSHRFEKVIKFGVLVYCI